MKKQLTILIILILIPILGRTQQPSMNPGNMQQMMQQAQQLRECFSKIDQQALQALGQKAQAMETEIKSLCQAGNRSEAQSSAIKFGLSMSQDENIQEARDCGEMAKGLMPKIDYPTSVEDLEGKHVCDAL